MSDPRNNPSEQMLTVTGSVNKSLPVIDLPEGIKINVATPCYGGTYATSYVISIINLLTSWRKVDIGYSFSEVDTSDIELSRNILISNFYFNKPDCTHILFIDDDMGFNSSMINRMIALNKDVVGVIAPKRQIDLRKLHAEKEADFATALARSVSFALNPAKEKKAKDGFIEVNSCGTGILLISRECITKMADCCPEIIDRGTYKKVPVAGDFEVFLTPFKKMTAESKSLSEDFSFCYRWVNQCNGKIFANIDSNIKHVGTHVVESRYQDL